METDGNVISASLIEANDYQDDDDETYYEEKWGNHVLQQQWVTLTASMWPEPTASPRGWTWRVPTERLPLLAAIFCGAALVVCVLFAFVVYRCCIMPRREKHYCLRKVDGVSPPNSTQMPPVVSPAYPNQTAVYAEQKNFGWGYTNRLIAQNTSSGGHWLYNSQFIGGPQCTQCPGTCPVPRSCSNPGPSAQVSVNNTTAKRQRPFSQPGPASVHLNGEIIPKEVPILEISEFSPSHQQHAQYASSSVLDEVSAKEDSSGEPTLKTRSLPAWVRSKPRPLSTEDDLNDLYAKVNFSKKRKNRMRNDEAAIIALSKSRSQFLHKDTDSLVDNEAVIVYDERTAL